MGSRGGGGGGAGVGLQSIPAASRKMVQSLKEIVNSPELEIYAVLKDCNMDPNEAVNRLLTQDPFREVKSKREKKKEIKDPTESRPRGAGSASNRGGRSGTDRYAGRGGSAQFNTSESGGLQGKSSYRRENGMSSYTSSSPSAYGLSENNSSRRPTTFSESVINESESSAVSGVDAIASVPQPSSGGQSAWVRAPGQKSMADIVKMGLPQSKPYNSTNSTVNPSYNNFDQNFPPPPSSTATHQTLYPPGDYASKVSGSHHDLGAAPDQHVPTNDEWPLDDPPQVSGISSVLGPRDTELDLSASNLSYDNHYHGSQMDEVVHEEDDSTFGDQSLNNLEPASVPTSNSQDISAESTNHYDEEMYKNIGSFHSQEHVYEQQEEEDIGASVSSVNANMQQLSIQEEDQTTTPEDDGPSVVIPNHLQVQSADCSHLSFGSFGSGGINAPLFGSFGSRAVRSKLEETPTEAHVSTVGLQDSRKPDYYGDEPQRTSPDENLVHMSGNAGAYDSAAASQPEVLKQENSEMAHGNQYAFPSGAPGYNFESTQLLNTSYPQSQPTAQMQNLAPFSNTAQQVYTNSLPSSLLGANGHPVRESDLSYSPFPITQSMPTKYSNTVPSISSSTISMAEALKTAGFASTQVTQQTPQGNNVSTGPALAQHLAVHPYSQQTLPLGPFTNMIGYPFLPPSYTYMPSGFQQAFAGNSTYHQPLAAAAVPPQYKNSVSVSSLPQSASGYGAFGSSGTIPGNYPMNPTQAGPAGSSISYEDLLSSQYKDNSHLLSLQQQAENSAMWLHGGAGSRTISAVPASTYYSFQGQNQQAGGYRQGQQPSQNFGSLGYPNFYQSQAGISLEHQQQQQNQNPRDGSLGGSQGQPKQSQQIWQNGY